MLTHGRLKLTNLGYTTKYAENKALKHQSSTHWLAPEVAAGGPFTDKADIWAVGMLAIELATGELPKGPDSFKTLQSSQPKDEPPRLHGDFSRNFKDFVAACLVKDPAEVQISQGPLSPSSVSNLRCVNREPQRELCCEITSFVDQRTDHI